MSLGPSRSSIIIFIRLNGNQTAQTSVQDLQFLYLTQSSHSAFLLSALGSLEFLRFQSWNNQRTRRKREKRYRCLFYIWVEKYQAVKNSSTQTYFGTSGLSYQSISSFHFGRTRKRQRAYVLKEIKVLVDTVYFRHSIPKNL